ncbi:MAG: cytochrome b/b6 domain-containing protein [Rhodospirillales bacterium]
MTNGEPTKSGDVQVWDIAVRLFHWLLVGFIVVCLTTEDDVLALHVFAGYTAGLLIVLRIVWAGLGPSTARFRWAWFSPRAVGGYLRDVVAFRAKRYLDHSPAGGAMFIAFLVVIGIAVVTGVASYAAEEHAGPLAAYLGNVGPGTRGLLGTIHESAANLLWILIAVHVAAVALTSLVHRENLVLAMVTGKKRSYDRVHATD